MYVIVVGAGEVGRTIATNLQDSHDVAIVDRDGQLVEELTYELDVLTVNGDGTKREVLEQAGLETAQMVIACTDNDETNAVVCGTAKTVSDAFTIARVRRRTLLETWQGSQTAFGVDFMVCTDLLAARAVFRVSGIPGAQDVNAFAGGLVRMAEVEIGPDSPVTGRTVSEADHFDSMTFAALFREEEMIVATGETPIEAGDRVVVIGSAASVRSFASEVTPGVAETDEIVIVGGSSIGFQIAREFEDHGYSPRLIEGDAERARECAEALPKTTVLQNDPTDMEFLETEHVDRADVVIAALESDEQNLLVSLLGRRLGVKRTIAVIEHFEYADIFETVGVDAAINPREETAEEIVRFTRKTHTEKVAMLEGDRAEVIEIEIRADSPLVGRQIADSIGEFPDGVVIGAISRGGELITPRGDTVINPGDHVVVFVDAEVLDRVLEVI